MKFTIPGQVPSKKNSRNIFVRGGKIVNIPNKRYQEWHKDTLRTLSLRLKTALGSIKTPYHVTYTIYTKDKRLRDLSNMVSSLDDLLVDFGLIEDDNCTIIAKETAIFGGIDKNNPRVEVEIVSL
jgi:Holliday junction resolvase RusA-like endonuclease